MDQIPVDSGRQTMLKIVARLPTQLGNDLRGINRIAPVVARPICHGGNQAGMGGSSRQPLIEQGVNCLHHLLVGAPTE